VEEDTAVLQQPKEISQEQKDEERIPSSVMWRSTRWMRSGTIILRWLRLGWVKLAHIASISPYPHIVVILTTIWSPVHPAVWFDRGSSRLWLVIDSRVSVSGSYIPPDFKGDDGVLCPAPDNHSVSRPYNCRCSPCFRSILSRNGSPGIRYRIICSTSI